MVLNELWQLKPVSEVANAYKLDRGLVQNLLGMAAIEASCLLKFCEVLEEFWAFRDLFKNLSERLSYVCSAELVPLMKLPCVKLVRIEIHFRIVSHAQIITFNHFRDERNNCMLPVIRKSMTLRVRNQKNWSLILST